MRNLKCIIIIAVAVLLLGRPCVGAEYVADAKTLRGIKSIYVDIRGLNKKEKEGGLTDSLLRTDVEIKLTLAGIAVASSEEFYSNPNCSRLRVAIASFRTDLQPILSPFFVSNISVGLEQGVYLERGKNIRCIATTWERWNIGLADEKEFTEHVRKKLKGLVDMFLDDYLAVNPIKPTLSKGAK
jgi:hypothetical protein